MTGPPALDAAGRRRSPATCRATTAVAGLANEQLYPADPATVEEIIAVMRGASDDRRARSPVGA